VNFTFSGSDAFKQIVLASDGRSFEVDNLAVNAVASPTLVAATVREPASLALVGAGLIAFGMHIRRRRLA
jgi:hypothetical protein